MHNMAKAFTLKNDKIINALKLENVEGGLLENVKQIITTDYFDERLKPPSVHVIESTTLEESQKGNQRTFKTTFNFVCIDYYKKDLFEAQKRVLALAGNVFNSILKNMNKPINHPNDKDLYFSKCNLNRLDPVGEIVVENLYDEIPIVMLVLDFYYRVGDIRCHKF